MSLSEVSFVPRTDFSGTAVISYTGYATNGKSFNGTIRVDVEDVGDVSYTVRWNLRQRSSRRSVRHGPAAP